MVTKVVVIFKHLSRLKGKKDQNTKQCTWKPWKESRVAWGRRERVGGPEGGEICWGGEVVGEMGEVGPRKEGWRRVGHLTGGGHPLSQSTSVTVPPLTTHWPHLYHTAVPRTVSRRSKGCVGTGFGELGVELLGAGRDTHWWTKLKPPANTSAPPPPPETTHQLHLRTNLGSDLLRRKSPPQTWRVWGGALLRKKSWNHDFWKLCHLQSGDQLVAAGGDLPPACFLPPLPNLLIVNVY